MTLELTIQKLFNNYPSLYKERADCLDQLFVCIGNGYTWENGELVDGSNLTTDEIRKLESDLVDGKAFQHNKLSLRAESQLYEQERINNGWYEEYSKKYPDEDIKHLKEVRQKTIAKLPDDIYYREPNRRYRWYCCWKLKDEEIIDFHKRFAFLFNYPEDIKEDWLAGIEETKKLLAEDELYV